MTNIDLIIDQIQKSAIIYITSQTRALTSKLLSKIQGKICIVLPTVQAVISSFNRSTMRNIGYIIPNKNHTDNQTKIIYVTSEIILKLLIKSYGSNIDHKFCDTIIIDYFYLRTKDADFALCFLDYLHLIAKPVPKVVLISNSIDQTIANNFKTKTIVYNSEPIKIKTFFDSTYSFEASTLIRYKKAALMMISHSKTITTGNYIVFVPTNYEADIVNSILFSYFKEKFDIILIDNLLVLNSYKFNSAKRKIFISTDVGEGIDFEDISLVIDTCTFKYNYILSDEAENNDIRWISKEKSANRKSKITIDNGIYVVMMFDNHFDGLADYSKLQINNGCISSNLLDLIANGFDPTLVLNTLVPINQIKSNITLLQNLGFIIGSKCNHLMYNFSLNMPIGIRKCAMLYKLYAESNPDFLIHLAVICSLQSYGSGVFKWPKKDVAEDSQMYSIRCDDILQYLEDKYAGYSDIDTLINIWIDIFKKTNPFYLINLKKYCKKNILSYNHFISTVSLIKTCMTIINSKNLGSKIYFNQCEVICCNYVSTIISQNFYLVLCSTFKDYVCTSTSNIYTEPAIIFDNQLYKVNKKSVNLMNVGNDPGKVYFILVKSHKMGSRGELAISNVLHTFSIKQNQNFVLDFEDDDW